MTPRLRITAPTLEAVQELQRALAPYRTELVEESGSWSLSISHDREFNMLLLGVIDGATAALREHELDQVVLHVDDRAYGLAEPAPLA